MNLIVQVVVLFILLMLYLSSTNPGERNNWGIAILLAVALPVLGMLPNEFGIIGWFVAIVVSIALISKILRQSVISAIFLFLILGIVQYIVQLGIYRYIQ